MNKAPRSSTAVVSNPTPGTAVTPTASQEVLPNGATTPPAVTGSGVRYAGSPLSLAIVQGILTGTQDFGTAFQPQYQALEDDFILLDPAHRQGVGVVGPRKLVALPMIVQVMAQNPALPSAQSVAQINASIEAASAMKKLQATFLQLASHCGDTARVLDASAWRGVAPAYAAARSQATHDQTLAPLVSAIAAVLSHGPKADTAVQTAAKTHDPRRWMPPVSSATGMNAFGGIAPRS